MPFYNFGDVNSQQTLKQQKCQIKDTVHFANPLEEHNWYYIKLDFVIKESIETRWVRPR